MTDRAVGGMTRSAALLAPFGVLAAVRATLFIDVVVARLVGAPVSVATLSKTSNLPKPSKKTGVSKRPDRRRVVD